MPLKHLLDLPLIDLLFSLTLVLLECCILNLLGFRRALALIPDLLVLLVLQHTEVSIVSSDELLARPTLVFLLLLHLTVPGTEHVRLTSLVPRLVRYVKGVRRNDVGEVQSATDFSPRHQLFFVDLPLALVILGIHDHFLDLAFKHLATLLEDLTLVVTLETVNEGSLGVCAAHKGLLSLC